MDVLSCEVFDWVQCIILPVSRQRRFHRKFHKLQNPIDILAHREYNQIVTKTGTEQQQNRKTTQG
jgi:hypothetical protein